KCIPSYTFSLTKVPPYENSNRIIKLIVGTQQQNLKGSTYFVLLHPTFLILRNRRVRLSHSTRALCRGIEEFSRQEYSQ
ncbi:hypothetical protein, partial [Exiguobacterium sp. UBA4960]|uniref:hypothetical protein n=1 Tax=Exiguobacterium sp. UBA4960 TaxID=1946496 RepID=UPI0025C25CD5